MARLAPGAGILADAGRDRSQLLTRADARRDPSARLSCRRWRSSRRIISPHPRNA